MANPIHTCRALWSHSIRATVTSAVLHRYSLSRLSILRILIRPIRTLESHTAATRWYVATQPIHLDQTTQDAMISLKPSPPSRECNNSCRDKKRHSATRGSNDIRQSAWPRRKRPRQTDGRRGSHQCRRQVGLARQEFQTRPRPKKKGPETGAREMA
jgi:hypothetical protein